MASIKYFIEKYQLYSDEELFETFLASDEYSNVAKDALEIVTKNRGGLEKIGSNSSGDRMVVAEIKRIKREAQKLSSQETNSEFLKTLITSSIIPKERVNKLIDEQYALFEAFTYDTSINSKTIGKAFVGTILATVFGCVYINFVLSNMNQVPIILLVALLPVCYIIINITTRKSKENTIVFAATFISFTLSLVFGYLFIGDYKILI